MDEHRYLKKVIESPETRFEKDESKRLRRFSSRSEEIVRIRQKLRELRESLESSEEDLAFQKEIFSGRDEIPAFRNRYYDRPVVKAVPRGFTERLGGYFRLRQSFREKYPDGTGITSSLINYIINGAPFYPSEPVCAFVQDILFWQEELREPFRRMYAAGWLDKSGADVLTPLEFNLISEAERLVNDPSIFNFLIYHRKPHLAIGRINPFLGYYLSVTRSIRFKLKLHDAVRESLRMAYPSPGDAGRVEAVMSALEKLLSDNVERRFIIPLFECAYQRPLDGESLRALVCLDELDENAYRADRRLMEAMEERKRRFNEILRQNIFVLEEELNFVLDLKEIVEAGYELPNDRTGDFLDHLLLYYYHNRDAKTTNLPLTAGDLCDIFTLTYESLLSEGIKLKVGQEQRTIKLFEKSLFAGELETIRTRRRDFIESERKGYTPHLLYKDDPDGGELFFLKALIAVTDAFYSIGEKLFAVIHGHEGMTLKEERTADSLIGEKNIGRARVPYAAHVAAGSETSSVYQYTVANRRVMEVLEDTKKFAITFAHRFEYRRRDFTGAPRRESIAGKIRALDDIIRKIRGLESGERSVEEAGRQI